MATRSSGLRGRLAGHQDDAAYLDQHQELLEAYMTSAVAELLVARPADPKAFLARQRGHVSVPSPKMRGAFAAPDSRWPDASAPPARLRSMVAQWYS